MEHTTCRNKIITPLSSTIQQALMQECEWVFLQANTLLHTQVDTHDYTYFPSGTPAGFCSDLTTKSQSSALIVLLMEASPLKPLALGFIGEEGLCDVVSLLWQHANLNDLSSNHTMANGFPPYSASVHGQGWALKISNPALYKLMLAHPSLNTRLMNYLAVMHSQLAQAVVCHHYHLLPQRLARLLLMLQDRLHTKPFFVTQALLSQWLGVRRVGVTKAASDLQEKKIVTYRRGKITIMNVRALQRLACPCYRIDQLSYKAQLATTDHALRIGK